MQALTLSCMSARLRKVICVMALSVAFFVVAPSFSASFSAPAALNSDAIAGSALRVAESTRSTGHCYAAVARALRPLGVSLSGEAACQAAGLLLADRRFIAIAVHSVADLKRGDIVVYACSLSHPYGHIAVCEGNDREASDHVAPVTSPQAYGSATVFRLRSEGSLDAPAFAPEPAPDFNTDFSPVNRGGNGLSAPLSRQPAVGKPPDAPATLRLGGRILRLIRHGCSSIAGRSLERSLIRKYADWLRN
jgi:hypothetical protein